jgi:hypothetical protein
MGRQVGGTVMSVGPSLTCDKRFRDISPQKSAPSLYLYGYEYKVALKRKLFILNIIKICPSVQKPLEKEHIRVNTAIIP